MTILEILQFIAVIGTFATGLFSLIWPRNVEGFTGLSPLGGRGITEIRSILGGVFIGLAAAAFFLDHAVSYPMLGITYLVIALVRTVSMFLDDSLVSSNYISIATEVIFGVLLIL
jgi:hypothetical protein